MLPIVVTIWAILCIAFTVYMLLRTTAVVRFHDRLREQVKKAVDLEIQSSYLPSDEHLDAHWHPLIHSHAWSREMFQFWKPLKAHYPDYEFVTSAHLGPASSLDPRDPFATPQGDTIDA